MAAAVSVGEDTDVNVETGMLELTTGTLAVAADNGVVVSDIVAT